MKILITTPSYPPIVGGLGNAVFRQASILKSEGHYVQVATSLMKSNYYRKKMNSIEVKEFDVKGADWCIRPITGEVKEYKEFLLRSNFDVIIMHAWQNWATDLIFKYSDLIQGKKYLHSHCISTNEFYSHQPVISALRFLAWRPYFYSLKEKISKLDGIFFLSDVESESRFLDLEVARMIDIKKYIIPNMLSLEATELLDRKVVPGRDRNQLIAVGSYEWQKGFDFVIKSYAASSAKNILKLCFYGQKFTEYTNDLSILAKNLGIDNKYIQFYEGVTGRDLLEEYSKSKIFLLGSHTECQPMVLLDANATGTPFVANNTGCIKRMPGGVAVHSIEEMSFEIDKLINNEGTWNELSRLGIFAAKNIYNSDVVRRALLDAIS